MAKATKSDAGDKPAPKKKEPASAAAAKKAPAAKEAAAAAPAAKKAPAPAAKKPAKSAKSTKSGATVAAGSPTPPLAPPIDTGLAAAAAASMIANRAVAGLGATSQGGGAKDPAAKQESSTFKSLKEGLSKPPVGGLGAILGGGGGSTKFNQGFGGPKPSVPGGAKNQTFGADVNRAGVPRRTGG